MKKILAVILAFAAVLSLAACNSVQLEGTLEEISKQVLDNTTTIEMMLGDPMEIDLADVDVAKYYIGVDPTDKVERAVFTEPMIGSIPFSLCLVKAAEGADVDALKNEILEGVDYRKWICVAAEKVLVTNCGDTILMIMSTEEIVEDVYNAFNTVAMEKAEEPVTKAGEVMEEPALGVPTF
ncbi:MAG: hypothetical protein E7547_08205 [Ruminococcaceae bacterium]|nr:hypothetical protein [Oscillospiraceae bacterium]